MGLLHGSAVYLHDLCSRYALKGDLLTLGKQNVLVRPEEWTAAPNLPTERHLSWSTAFVASEPFFQQLGFSSVESLDVSIYENATHKVDLNSANLPPDLVGRYDVIFDGSTLEHIFNVPQALAHIHSMLRVGGRVIHMSPSNHFMDDGFYQLSPTFFVDYYRACGYVGELLALHFMKVQVTDHPDGGVSITTKDRFVSHSDANLGLRAALFQPHDQRLCQTWFMARKTGASAVAMPMQSRYKDRDYWVAGL